jgi:hypothetical protein
MHEEAAGSRECAGEGGGVGVEGAFAGGAADAVAERSTLVGGSVAQRGLEGGDGGVVIGVVVAADAAAVAASSA